MEKSGSVQGKVRSYLEGLTPKARDMLLRGLEVARSEGSLDEKMALILDAARIKPDVPVEPKIRLNTFQREYFALLDPFLIDERLPRRQTARIERSSLNNIWTWIKRDIAPEQAAAVGAKIASRELSEEEFTKLVDKFRNQIKSRIEDKLDLATCNADFRRRLAMHLGGDHIIADIRDMITYQTHRHLIEPVTWSFSEGIGRGNLISEDAIADSVFEFADNHPDLVVWVAAAALAQVDHPNTLLAFAAKLAESESAGDIEDSPFAPFVDMVLSEADRNLVRTKMACRQPPDPDLPADLLETSLGNYHDLMRGLSLEIELDHAPNWRKQAATIRKDISVVVTRDIKATPGLVRRTLREPRVNSAGVLELDQHDIDDAKRALKILGIVRKAAEFMAVNEIITQTSQIVDQTLDIVCRTLISDLGRARGKKRDAVLLAVNVGIDYVEIFYGEKDADLMRRSRQAALNKQNGGQRPKVGRTGTKSA